MQHCVHTVCSTSQTRLASDGKHVDRFASIGFMLTSDTVFADGSN